MIIGIKREMVGFKKSNANFESIVIVNLHFFICKATIGMEGM
jgi:hypothetical protein